MDLSGQSPPSTQGPPLASVLKFSKGLKWNKDLVLGLWRGANLTLQAGSKCNVTNIFPSVFVLKVKYSPVSLNWKYY